MGVAGDVDGQMPEGRVRGPRRGRTCPRVVLERAGQLDLHLGERVVARSGQARCLRRWTDEQAGEQIRDRRVVLEEGDEACEQAWIAQPRAVLRLRAAERDVVAPSGPGGATVEQVLLRVQPGVEGGVEDRLERRTV